MATTRRRSQPASIFLVGLPSARQLNWDERGLLPVADVDEKDHESQAIRWRAVAPRNNSGGGDGDAKDTVDNGDEGQFYDGGSITRYSGLPSSQAMAMDDDGDADSDSDSGFYDQSLVVHETMNVDADGDGDGDYDYDDDSSTTVNATPIALPGPFTSIADLPRSPALFATLAHPPTVNLIVAIIMLRPTRRVRTRWGQDMDVVEVVVGDDTAGAGLRISCWLSTTTTTTTATATTTARSARHKRTLHDDLSALRTGDIVFIRPVALRLFRGQVYAHSLRNNGTRIDLLHRRVVDRLDVPGRFTAGELSLRRRGDEEDVHPQIRKVMRVRKWLMAFVGPTTTDASANARKRKYGDDDPEGRAVASRPLPPDTQ